MKTLIRKFQIAFIFLLILTSCKSGGAGEYQKAKAGELSWITIEQAATLKNSDEKMFFIDLYTDWCGWCKKMDKSTFKDVSVVKLLDEKFHVVKFNAEQKTPISWMGKEHKFIKSGRRGANTLAQKLLNGRLGYPSFAILDKDRNPIKIIVGYKKANDLIAELQGL